MKKPKFFESFGLKLLAVFISIMLWLVVINVSDPVSSNTYSGIALQPVNAESITSQGKVYEIAEGQEVTITVNAKRSILDSLANDNFKAYVDLSRYDEEAGAAPIRVESNKHNDVIESIKSKTEYASVNVEDMLRKQFIITPVVTGEPEEGYVIGDVTTAENIVRISGAESVVGTIKKVTAEVNVGGLSSSITTSVDLKLYDAQDELIRDTGLIKNISTVAVSVQFLATKEVELKVAGASGTPAEGYCLSAAPSADRQTILVAAKSNVVSSVSEIEIPASAVSAEGLTEAAQLEVDVSRYLPDGFSLPEGQEKTVLVTVPIEARQNKQVDIDSSKVVVQNLPSEYRGEIVLPERITLDFSGSATDLESLKATDIKLSVDWEEYAEKQEIDTIKEMTYRLPLSVTFPQNTTVVLTRDMTVSLKVTAKKKQ